MLCMCVSGGGVCVCSGGFVVVVCVCEWWCVLLNVQLTLHVLTGLSTQHHWITVTQNRA